MSNWKLQCHLWKSLPCFDSKVDLKSQSVLVTSSLPSSQLIDLIENKVGKKAVIMGTSGTIAKNRINLGAAVAMLGGIIGCGSVQVRFLTASLLSGSSRYFVVVVAPLLFSELFDIY